jgi:hypothetical protein
VAKSTAKRAENTATTKFTPASRTRTSHPSTTLQAHLCGDAETDFYPGSLCGFSHSDECKKKKARDFMISVFGAAKAFNMVTRRTQFDVLCRTAFIVLRVSNYSSQQLSCRFVAASNEEIAVPTVFFFSIFK